MSMLAKAYKSEINKVKSLVRAILEQGVLLRFLIAWRLRKEYLMK